MSHLPLSHGTGIPMNPALKAQIQAFAEKASRSPESVVEDAVREYIGRQQWESQLLSDTTAPWEQYQATHGAGSLPFETLEPWLESLGTENELPPPFKIPDGLRLPWHK